MGMKKREQQRRWNRAAGVVWTCCGSTGGGVPLDGERGSHGNSGLVDSTRFSSSRKSVRSKGVCAYFFSVLYTYSRGDKLLDLIARVSFTGHISR